MKNEILLQASEMVNQDFSRFSQNPPKFFIRKIEEIDVARFTVYIQKINQDLIQKFCREIQELQKKL